MEDLNKYKEYTVEEFVLDEDFQEIVNHQNSGLSITDLIQRYPSKKREIRLASNILKALRVAPIKQDPQKIGKFWQSIIAGNRRPLRSPGQFQIAAAILVLLVISVVIYYQGAKNKVTDDLSKDEAQYAELILSNGESIEIDSPRSTLSYSSDGAGVVVNDSTKITQKITQQSYNQLIVPFGKQSYVELSDGTEVWLNSGSKLDFPPVFSGRERVVRLDGEGFLKVSKDENRPFLVKTDRATLKVYGTEFNFQAYHIDESYHIVLVEGSVSLKTNEANRETFIKPSQKATIYSKDSEIEIKNIDNTEIYTAWKDGYLTFVNEDVSEVLKRVSRYYNINVRCDKDSQFDKIYGKLDLKNEFMKVLNGVAFISNANLEKRGGEYVFVNKTLSEREKKPVNAGNINRN